MNLIPFRVSSPPVSTVRPVGRIDLPEFWCPLTASSNKPPWSGAGLSRPLRVPLPGFLNLSAVFQASPSSTALFHAATVCELPPSELSPREDRETLSGSLAFPAVIHPWLKCVACGLITPRFSQLPGLPKGSVAWRPRATMDSLSYRPEGLHPGRPGPPTAGPLPTTSFTRFEAFFPSRIRSRQTRVAPNRRSLLSWSFLSSLETKLYRP